MESLGWFRLLNGRWIFHSRSPLTGNQCDFIFDWHILNDQPLDDFLVLLKNGI